MLLIASGRELTDQDFCTRFWSNAPSKGQPRLRQPCCRLSQLPLSEKGKRRSENEEGKDQKDCWITKVAFTSLAPVPPCLPMGKPCAVYNAPRRNTTNPSPILLCFHTSCTERERERRRKQSHGKYQNKQIQHNSANKNAHQYSVYSTKVSSSSFLSYHYIITKAYTPSSFSPPSFSSPSTAQQRQVRQPGRGKGRMGRGGEIRRGRRL